MSGAIEPWRAESSCQLTRSWSPAWTQNADSLEPSMHRYFPSPDDRRRFAPYARRFLGCNQILLQAS